MNRVWKKFFGKLAEPLIIMAYVSLATVLVMWTGENVSEGMAIVIFCVMIPIPMIAYLIRDMWRDAKREVEWENREVLNTLKGD